METHASKSLPIFTGLLLLGCYPAGSVAQEKPVTRAGELQWVTPVVDAPRLRHRTFDSTAAQTKVSYHIYLPETYDTQQERRFPVLYWLHGGGPGLAGIPHVVKRFGTAIRVGKMPPVLVVFPNGTRSMWCDSKDGRVPMETVVMKELLPHIDATYRTIASREGRLVEGFSMGGYGAARLGFKYPDVFGAVSILSGGPLQRVFNISPRTSDRGREMVLKRIYGGDMEYFKAQSPWLLAERGAGAIRRRTRIRLVIGERDEMLQVTREFNAHLTRLGIPHTFTVLPGIAHKPMALLNALGEDNWEFYRTVFGAKASANKGEDETNAQQHAPADTDKPRR